MVQLPGDPGISPLGKQPDFKNDNQSRSEKHSIEGSDSAVQSFVDAVKNLTEDGRIVFDQTTGRYDAVPKTTLEPRTNKGPSEGTKQYVELTPNQLSGLIHSVWQKVTTGDAADSGKEVRDTVEALRQALNEEEPITDDLPPPPPDLEGVDEPLPPPPPPILEEPPPPPPMDATAAKVNLFQELIDKSGQQIGTVLEEVDKQGFKQVEQKLFFNTSRETATESAPQKVRSYSVIDLSKRKELGSGAFGIVYQVQDLFSKRAFALKVLQDTQGEALYAESRASLDREVDILRKVGPGRGIQEIPHCLVAIKADSDVHREGFIARLYDQDCQLPPTRIDLAEAFEDPLAGLEVIHRHGIIHSDIKPENLFLDGSSIVLADFGGAVDLDEVSLQALSTRGGTEQFMHPNDIATFKRLALQVQTAADEQETEKLRTKLATLHRAADIYSMGISFMEMAIAHGILTEVEKGIISEESADDLCDELQELAKKFCDTDPRDVAKMPGKEYLPGKPHEQEQLAQLILQMTAPSPKDRPTAEALLAAYREIFLPPPPPPPAD